MLFYFLKFNRLTLFSKRWKTCHLDSVSSVSMMQQEYTKRERDGIFLICFYPLNFCNSFQPIWETSFNRCFDYRKAIYDVINQSEIPNQDFVTYNNTKKILVTSIISPLKFLYFYSFQIFRNFGGIIPANSRQEFPDLKTIEHRGERAREENCRLLEVLPVYTYIFMRVVELFTFYQGNVISRRDMGPFVLTRTFYFRDPRATPHFNLADECARELHKHRIAVSILNLYRDARCLQCERVSSVFFSIDRQRQARRWRSAGARSILRVFIR